MTDIKQHKIIENTVQQFTSAEHDVPLELQSAMPWIIIHQTFWTVFTVSRNFRSGRFARTMSQIQQRKQITIQFDSSSSNLDLIFQYKSLYNRSIICIGTLYKICYPGYKHCIFFIPYFRLAQLWSKYYLTQDWISCSLIQLLIRLDSDLKNCKSYIWARIFKLFQ